MDSDEFYLPNEIVDIIFAFAECSVRRTMRLFCKQWNVVCCTYNPTPYSCCETPYQFTKFTFWDDEGHNPSLITFLTHWNYELALNIGLRWASKFGRVKLVRRLLDVGADVHTGDDSSLIFACNYGNDEVVKLLLKVGANVHIGDDTPLIFACYNGYIKIVRLLLVAGADVHAIDEKPLLDACLGGYYEIIQLLLKAGADVHARDNKSFVIARRRRRIDIHRLLFEYSHFK